MVAKFLTGPPAMKNPSKRLKKESSGARFIQSLITYAALLGLFLGINAALNFFHIEPQASLHNESARMTFMVCCYALLLVCLPLLGRAADYKMTKKKLEDMDAAQSNAYGDDVIKLSQQAIEMPVALPVAWDCLKEATNGLDIKALDKRRAAWLVDSVDDDRRIVRCSLQYMADPLGRKLSQIYPRTIEMVASLDGHGVNTRLRTRYTFATPMDLEAVSEIISKTNSRLNEMITIADKSIKDQREQMRNRSTVGVAELEKPKEYDFESLGSIDLPLSLN